MRVSFRFAALAAAATFLFGCASMRTPALSSAVPAPPRGTHLETVAKQKDSYEMLANGRVRIYARGEFVLDHEDAGNLFIVVYEPAAETAPTFPVPVTPGLSTGPIRDLRGSVKLVDVGAGLPHTGQWRDHFAVGDLLGNGSPQIVFGPARKSGGGPVAFREQADGWQRVPLQVPAAHYDYGGAAIGDFDGDGRNDLALAMHLSGFSVLRATPAGTFERIDAGLPNRGNKALFGSGRAALALPAAPHEPARLLLLEEIGASASEEAQRAPALADFRYTTSGFVAEAVTANRVPGDGLAYAPAGPTCRAKLAVASSVPGAPVVLEEYREHEWAARTLDSFPNLAAVIGSIALGDVDDDGCSDFAVAYASRVDQAWHSLIDIYLDRGTRWKRVNLLDAPSGARVTAMASAPLSGGTILLTVDTDGVLRGYRYRRESAELVLEMSAPEWRQGCSGSDIHVLSNDVTHGLRIVASFAGEPTMGQFDRCRGGGGIQAWRMEQRSVN